MTTTLPTTEVSFDKQTVTVLIYNSRNQLLLQQRCEKAPIFPFWWTTPGGHVEDGESPETAAARELEEEFELETDPQHVFSYTRYMLREGKIIKVLQHVYLQYLEKEASEIPVHEGIQVAWCDQAAVRDLPLAFGFKKMCLDFLSQNAPLREAA